MAICVYLNSRNRVIADPLLDPNTCADYVLLSGTEYTNLPSLTDIFNIPLATDLQQMFMIGIELPLIAYLTAWAYGVIINWFNDR